MTMAAAAAAAPVPTNVVHVSELTEDGDPLLGQYLKLKNEKDTGSKLDGACFIAEGRETVRKVAPPGAVAAAAAAAATANTANTANTATATTTTLGLARHTPNPLPLRPSVPPSLPSPAVPSTLHALPSTLYPLRC